MVYKFLISLSEHFSSFNIFRYITFRSFLAFFTSFFICWFFAPFFIKNLKKKKIRQPIRSDGPEFHFKKSGTPTMGGGLILMSLIATAFLWMDLSNLLVLSALILTIGFGSIGFIDDKLKLKNKSSKGLSGDFKITLECLLTLSVFGVLIYFQKLEPTLTLPFLKDVVIQLSWFYLPFSCLVVVGAANSVNLTDGLDGLAIFPLIVGMGTFVVFSYVAGHSQMAEYLGIPFISGASELAPLAAGVVAAGLAFLWYNTYPAQVFMGDVGSLSLGGLLGALAVLTKNELLLILIGGIFVVEALSVIGQVFSFKLTGKRIFRMAPIHHHFEIKGLSETKIIVRFWIISILLAALALSTLKLR